jgi:hypothetical protein
MTGALSFAASLLVRFLWARKENEQNYSVLAG